MSGSKAVNAPVQPAYIALPLSPGSNFSTGTFLKIREP